MPTQFEVDGTVYGVSQPPIPTNIAVDTADYAAAIHKEVWGNGTPANFLMNHWGYGVKRDGKARIWTDFIGLARCYVVETPEIVAFSNHIGSLAFFMNESLDLDHRAIELFANFGWFMGDTTPYRGISRVPAGKIIAVDQNSKIDKHTYQTLSELVGERSREVDFSAILEPTRIAARNLDRVSEKTPTIYLSGGQDSRMSASLWLSGGSDANVVTFGNLEQESEIATELIRKYQQPSSQVVTHKITVNSASEVSMSLNDRLNKAHLMWDGDAAPTNMRRNIAIPRGSTAISIGGSNGEVARCHLYGQREFDRYSSGIAPAFDRLFRSYPGKVVTPGAAELSREFLENEYETISSAGVQGLVAVDAFYVRQKLRRWSNQQLLSTAAILLGSREFVRMSYDLTVQQRIDRVSPREIVKLAVPEWKDVPFYKGTVTDAQQITRRGMRIWLTDPDEFNQYMNSPLIWDEFLQKNVLKDYRSLIPSEEANRAHESWFQRAIWIDSIEKHRKHLNDRSKNARSDR